MIHDGYSILWGAVSILDWLHVWHDSMTYLVSILDWFIIWLHAYCARYMRSFPWTYSSDVSCFYIWNMEEGIINKEEVRSKKEEGIKSKEEGRRKKDGIIGFL